MATIRDIEAALAKSKEAIKELGLQIDEKTALRNKIIINAAKMRRQLKQARKA